LWSDAAARHASPVLALQEGADGGAQMVRIQFPHKNGKVSPVFIATAHVKANKNDYQLTDVTGTLVDKNGNTGAGWKIKPLKKDGPASGANSKVFVLVKALPPGPNLHKLTVTVKLKGTPYSGDQEFYITAGKGKKDEKKPDKGDKKERLFGFHHPMDDPYTISGFERDYFVPCGPADSATKDAVIELASGSTVKGIPHYDDSDPMDKIWWAEFESLAPNLGPGTLKITDQTTTIPRGVDIK
jgi:hypothetical protein